MQMQRTTLQFCHEHGIFHVFLFYNTHWLFFISFLSYHQLTLIPINSVLLTLFWMLKMHCIETHNVANRHIQTTMADLFQDTTKQQELSTGQAIA